MHTRISVRVGAVLTSGALALMLSGCVAPGPAAPSSAPATSSSPTASPTPTATPTTDPSEEPTSAPEPTEAPSPEPTAPSNGSVTVELLSASYDPSMGAVSAAAMVTDRVSNAGTCTLTVSQGEAVVSAQAPGEAGPSMTYCSALSVGLPAGAAGEWSVTVDYTESGFAGSTSGSVTVS